MDVSHIADEIGGATSKVAGFIMHYGSELTNVAGVLSSVLGALPIDAQDKDRISSVISDLESAAARAIAGANAVSGELGGEIVVAKSDVEAAVADFFGTDAGKMALIAAVRDAGN